MGETLPPLRVRETDGSPNVIPVYDIVLSTNLTLINKGGGVIAISATTGAGGTSQAPITFPLIVGSGGTGTADEFGSGGIVFAWTNNGAYAADTSRLFWHNLNKSLILSGVTTLPGFGEQVITAYGDVIVAGSSEFHAVQFGRTEGTFDSPVAVSSQIILGSIDWNGYDGTSYLTGANIRGVVDGSVGAGSMPGAIVFSTTLNGDDAPTEVARFTKEGRFGIGTTSPITLLDVAGSSRIQSVLIMSGNKIQNLALATVGSDAANKHYVDSVTGGGSSIVYAATGNDYVVMNLAGDLTSEYRLVQSGNSITVSTAAGLITINASTGDLSTKQNTITYPLGVNSGGTGQTSFTSYAILYGSGTFNVQTMPVLGSGWLVVGSAVSSAPQTLAVGSHGQMLTVNTSVAGALQWANTQGGSAGAVYARTGNTYLVMTLTDDLTAERQATASTGILITDNGAGSTALFSLSSPLVARAQNDTAPYIMACQNTAGANLLLIDSMGYGFPQTITWALALGGSNAGVGVNQVNSILAPRNGKIISCDARAKTAPTGADLIFDINLNGTTIWSTSANRITIANGATGGTQSTFNTLAFSRTDTFTIDIDQVGSTAPGKDITVQLLTMLRNQ